MQPPLSTPSLASRRPSPVSTAIQSFDRALQEVASWFVAAPRPASQAAEAARQLEMIALLGIVALGAVLRFWGLGVVGLHGDEKTMALPMMNVIEHGESAFPSGMPYVRAIFQVYLMAWSVELFGHSEWAMRLPSAVCGVALIPLAYYAGRRFLSTPWSLAFALVVTLLPEFMVPKSQTTAPPFSTQAPCDGAAEIKSTPAGNRFVANTPVETCGPVLVNNTV